MQKQKIKLELEAYFFKQLLIPNKSSIILNIYFSLILGYFLKVDFIYPFVSLSEYVINVIFCGCEYATVGVIHKNLGKEACR